ncbi:MAG: hypothetical protein SGARI_005694, partial [Bacillariaceae sp.]
MNRSSPSGSHQRHYAVVGVRSKNDPKVSDTRPVSKSFSRPSSLKKILKYSTFVKNDGNGPVVYPTTSATIKSLLKSTKGRGVIKSKEAVDKAATQESPTRLAAPSKRVVQFHEAIDWETESEKEEKRKLYKSDSRLRQFQLNETFLFVMLADINILIQCYNDGKGSKDLFEDLFSFYRSF